MRYRIKLFALVVLLVAIGLLPGSDLNAFAAATLSQPGTIWHDVSETSIEVKGARLIVPARYRTLEADEANLLALLDSAPLENTASRGNAFVVLPLPLPDGTFGRFAIQESPIMEPGLAIKFPQIKTYIGQGIDDRSATARLDYTPAGFHAMILSPSGTVFIDPYSRNDTEHYISYFKNDYLLPPGKAFVEYQDRQPPLSNLAPTSPDTPVGPTLRTYRLAVAATGEYTAFHGGTVTAGMTAIVISVNRVTGVYEHEVGVRLVLVANNNLIVYTNSGTDPYSNNNGSLMLSQNQSNLDSVIGSANYDIGHVFSTGGGGIAGLGVVCVGGSKAEGVTGSSSPAGDPFDIDYVAHEMGHQYGADHSFNGTTDNCGGGNRNASTAYEPGSGSTIMSYAGICGAEDLQAHSDAYFHTKSFDEIVAFITSGNGSICDATSSTGNSAPVVNAGSSFTIPNQTPFKLTGSATDPNGDPLTYNWEQFNLGTAAPPNTDNGNRPIFRSFTATTNPFRFFPKLSDILNNTTTLGESLPTTNRTLTFRLTARDNRAGGGGVDYSSVNIAVTTSSGPFSVTAPNTAVTWPGASTQTVTWNVAGTTSAPVSCATVNILLSTDGGNTFPTTLAGGTSNDGSENVTVPNTSTSTARVQVACATDIFLDISNTNFTISPGPGGTSTPTNTPTRTNTPTNTPTPTRTNTPGGPANTPTSTSTPLPSNADAFAYLTLPNPFYVAVGNRFTFDLIVYGGSNDITAAQNYITFPDSLVDNIRVSSAGCVLTNTITADLSIFDQALQNQVCNGPSPCTSQTTSDPGALAFASGGISNCTPSNPCSGEFRVGSIGMCATQEGVGTLHWDFAPPAPFNRNTKIVDSFSSQVSNPSLYTDQDIHVLPNTPISFKGHVSMQGRPPQPHPLQSVPVTLSVQIPSGTPSLTYGSTTDNQGVFTATLAAGGTYEYWVKNPQTLANRGLVNALDNVAPEELGELRAGDADNSNCVDIADFNILKGSFGRASGDPGYDGRSDFDGSTVVDVQDFNLLKTNFGTCGDTPLASEALRTGH